MLSHRHPILASGRPPFSPAYHTPNTQQQRSCRLHQNFRVAWDTVQRWPHYANAVKVCCVGMGGWVVGRCGWVYGWWVWVGFMYM